MVPQARVLAAERPDPCTLYLWEMEEKYGHLESGFPYAFITAPERTYIVPLAPGSPTKNYASIKGWIKDFCLLNGKALPKCFESKSKQQLEGMLLGMLEHYQIPWKTLTDHLKP